jgi:predicted LPLAT superfamily acyltransferase
MVIVKQKEWKGRTGGNQWGQKALIFLFRHCSVYIGYIILIFVIPFYMLFAHKGYKSIYHYFRYRHGYTPFRSFINTYLNHYIFGQVVLDRFAIFSGRRDYKIDIAQEDLVPKWFNQEKGFILLSSHIGNFEICGYFLKQQSKHIHALIYGGETEMINNTRQQIMEHNNISLIQVRNDFSHVFAISNALQNKDIVTMPADRNLGSKKTITCSFLNGSAEFPLGPFSLSTQFEVPVLAAFVIKVGIKRYKVLLYPILSDNDSLGSNAERTKSLAINFTKKLEDVVKAYPLQWFNFYEFWNN